MINELLLKQIAILSAIAGAALGFLTIFPYINIFSLSILVICLAAGILVYMKRENLIGIFDMREGAILGAVIGFVSFISHTSDIKSTTQRSGCRTKLLLVNERESRRYNQLFQKRCSKTSYVSNNMRLK